MVVLTQTLTQRVTIVTVTRSSSRVTRMVSVRLLQVQRQIPSRKAILPSQALCIRYLDTSGCININ